MVEPAYSTLSIPPNANRIPNGQPSPGHPRGLPPPVSPAE
jgi:hypothetical protein